jgi:integrase/recombinase XerD
MKTIEDLIPEYCDYLTSLRYSPETVRKRRELLNRFNRRLKEKHGIKTLDQLKPDHLKLWHAHLSTLRTSQGYPLKAAAINRHIIAVRKFLQYYAYPCDKLLPYLKEPKHLPGSVLAHAQVRKLLNKMKTDTSEDYRNQTMLEVLYSTGIRAGELLHLNTGDIDLKYKTAFINGKGDKQRVVPFGKTAARYLESYLKAVRPFLLQDKAEKALFLTKDGRRLSYGIFRRIVKHIAEKAGLDANVTAHTFRRSCTTELIRGGANMYHVKELLGHESLDTLKHYAKLTITDLKKTHEKCHPRERDED